MGRQFERVHSTTVSVPEAAEGKANRFIGFDGYYASSTAGGVKDSIGISDDQKYQDAQNVITGFTGVIELAEAVQPGDFLKPAADGSGKAAKGSATDHCARVRSAQKGGNAGEFIEAIILPHVHPHP